VRRSIEKKGGRGKARQGKARKGKARQGRIWQGKAGGGGRRGADLVCTRTAELATRRRIIIITRAAGRCRGVIVVSGALHAREVHKQKCAVRHLQIEVPEEAFYALMCFAMVCQVCHKLSCLSIKLPSTPQLCPASLLSSMHLHIPTSGRYAL
jgi:hypothetical protein